MKGGVEIKIIRSFVYFLLLFLAVNAIGGSYFLISDPSGKSIQIPIELLEGTPFDNYLIPGVILLFSIGFPSIMVAVSMTKNSEYHQLLIIFQGCVLIGWLTIQLILNPLFLSPILHYPLYVMGVLLIIFGFILKNGKQDDIQR